MEKRLKTRSKIGIFVFSVIIGAVFFILATAFPHLTPFQYTLFRIILALACAGVALLLPGLFNIRHKHLIGIVSGLIVFVLAYLLIPAVLVRDTGIWTHPAGLSDNISPDGQHTHDPNVAMDNNGNSIIVWEQSDGNNIQVFKSEYRNGQWIHPADLTDNISPNAQDVRYTQVAMDNKGNAIIVWVQSDGDQDQIFKSEYRNGRWSHPSSLKDNISLDETSANFPKLAMDKKDNVIIAWSQSDGKNEQIYKSEYHDSTWTHPADLTDNISPDGTRAHAPQVAMDNDGNTIVIWAQNDGSKDKLFKSEYRNGQWTHPTDLTDNISLDETHVESFRLAMSRNHALIVWNQYAKPDQVFKSEYRDGRWTLPTDLSDYISLKGANAYLPRLAMDNEGNAIILWGQASQTADIKWQFMKCEYRNGRWAKPEGFTEPMTSVNRKFISIFKPALDNNGNAIIVWLQHDGRNWQIYKNEYRNGLWSQAKGLSDSISPKSQDALILDVKMDDNGNAIIVWEQSDGSYNQIFKSEYRMKRIARW